MSENIHRNAKEQDRCVVGNPARLKIVVVTGAYLPGEKAGGPIRTIANLVQLMGDDCEFRIITSNRDHTESLPYPDIAIEQWTHVGKASVYYLPPERLRSHDLRRVIEAENPDLIYANSVLARSTVRLLFWKRFRRLDAPMLVATRGEMSPGAMAVRRLRKRLYFGIVRMVGLGRAVTWQASTSHEADEIRNQLGSGVNIAIAANPVHPPLPIAIECRKRPGSVRLLFLSRVARKKNLVFLLALLGRSRGQIALDVYGPQEHDYLQDVKDAITKLPDNVTVCLHPPVSHAEIDGVLGACHYFVLSTLGENFGHAIWEALRVGRPVLLSDTTPWQGLRSANAGWGLGLSDEAGWLAAIETCVEADQTSWDRDRAGALRYAWDWYRNNDFAEAHCRMFHQAMSRG